MISRLFDKLFSTEDEFSKKWMEKISRVLLGMVLCTIPFILLLLFLYMRENIGFKAYETTLKIYAGIMKPIIVSYFVCFIGYMGKAYLSKRNEEANKTINLSNESVEDIEEDVEDDDEEYIEEDITEDENISN